ncbi:holin, partial [Listeria monocytogenes]|nr:holin [Listeria monocytogenes]EAE4431478.1 holin [Listeria monocytogenes]EDO0900556.1 holin [Listeria monocytogenes]
MIWAGALAGAGGTGLFEQFTNRAKKYGKDD